MELKILQGTIGLNELGKLNLLAGANSQEDTWTHDGSNIHLISIKHEKVSCDRKPVNVDHNCSSNSLINMI